MWPCSCNSPKNGRNLLPLNQGGIIFPSSTICQSIQNYQIFRRTQGSFALEDFFFLSVLLGYKEWQSTPVSLPGEFHGQRRGAWWVSHMTEQLTLSLHFHNFQIVLCNFKVYNILTWKIYCKIITLVSLVNVYIYNTHTHQKIIENNTFFFLLIRTLRIYSLKSFQILSCKNWIASLCLTQDRACLGLVHGDDPQRCYGEGGGRGCMFGNTCKN